MRKEFFTMSDNMLKSIKLKYSLRIIYLIGILLMFSSCNKLVEIDPPTNSVVNEVEFSDSLNASSAILGLYGVMNSTNSPFASGNLTAFIGAYADEFGVTTTDDEAYPFFQGMLDPRTSGVISFFWEPLYNYIYHANVIIEEVSKSKGISDKNKTLFIGEAKFLRAYCYFYLVSLYGEVPLILTSQYKDNMSVPKSQQGVILDKIVADLQSAFETLPESYDWIQDQRTRANRYSAAALLSRAYLYKSDWINAEKFATIIIDRKDMYELAEDLSRVFEPNNKEAILQFFTDPSIPPYNATLEGLKLVPRATSIRFYLRDEFVNAIPYEDLRKRSWIDSIQVNGEKKYYARKYRLGGGMGTPGGSVPQYYTPFRLGEQYLIRAESRLRLQDFAGAKNDLDELRIRAGIGKVDDISAAGITSYLFYENMVEFMFEGGHRWFDIKRWGIADSVNSKIKTDWKSFRGVFPLPAAELQRNPLLVQNYGY